MLAYLMDAGVGLMGSEIRWRLEQALLSVEHGAERIANLSGVCQMPLSQTVGLPFHLFVETVEQAPVAISITDPKANIVYVNSAFTEVTGYAPEECVGLNESMLSDKNTPATVYRDLWSTLLSKRLWRGTLVNRHKDGRRYVAELTVAPMLDANSNVTHYIGMHRDVTDIYGLEQEVKNQKALTETVVDSMPVAAVLLDEDYRVILDNQRYKGLTSELGVVEPIKKFLDLLRQELGMAWEKYLRGGLGFKDRELRYDPGGARSARWFSCAGTWFQEGDIAADSYFNQRRKHYLLLTLTEITQQKRQQEEIRLSALKTLNAEEEKTQSLRETLSGVIHRIQGPMNQLAAMAGLMSRRAMDTQNAALVATLDQVIASSRETITMLQHCMPEPTQLRKAPVDLNQVVHEAILLMRDRLLASGIVVDWQPSPLLPSFAGDDKRLRGMFKQLIENAVNAMNEAHARNREIRLSTWQEHDTLHAAVADTGPGIPEDLRTRVFEPFFFLRASPGPQVGMGLAMVQDVVNQHDGLISIDPEYRDGCRIHIQFPRSRD